MAALTGIRAVVTGASRGIGAEIAGALVESGARVALIARGAGPLEQRARALGDRALPFPCDLRDAAAVGEMARAVTQAFGEAPDLVVNNAGMFEVARVEDTSPELLERMLRTNLMAPFLVVRAFLPGMRARGQGQFVTIGSTADRTIFPENGAYIASKFGLRAFLEVLRAELRGSALRSTLISPTAVDTTVWDDKASGESQGKFPPRNLMLPPRTIADAVLYAVTQPAGVNVDELRLSHS